MMGNGWTCAGNSCTRSDALGPGGSYPPISVKVNVAGNAPASVTNQVTVSGGGSATVSANDPTTIILVPMLSIVSSHTGNFIQGQNGTYTLTVSNAVGTGSTSGTVTVTETIPSGFTLVSTAGTGWTCVGNTCTCGDTLAPNTSYPPITLTVNAAVNAPSSVTNQVSVSGGGSATAAYSDPTTINPAPLLSISSTHTGSFIQGQTGVYTVTVNNASVAGPTSGTVTVTETLPSGLALVSMVGTGWSCPNGTCTRSDVLQAANSYPAIVVTVNVASNATSPQTNVVAVSGGSSAGGANTDSTTVVLPPDFTISLTSNQPSVVAGAAATFTVNVAGINGFNGEVDLSAVSLPTGATAIFSPSRSISGGSGSVTMTVNTKNTDLGGPTGNFSLTVTGTSPALPPHSASASLAIQDFTVTISPQIPMMSWNAQFPLTLQTVGVNGFVGDIAIECCAPQGPATPSLSWTYPSTITIGTSQPGSLNVTANWGAPHPAPPAYNSFAVLTVTATVGGVSHHPTVTVFPTNDLNFSLGANQTGQGPSTATYSVSATSTNVYSGTLTLNLTIPPCASTNQPPGAITIPAGGSGSTTFALNTSGCTPGNPYSVTVQATDGIYSNSLVVPSPSCRPPRSRLSRDPN